MNIDSNDITDEDNNENINADNSVNQNIVVENSNNNDKANVNTDTSTSVNDSNVNSVTSQNYNTTNNAKNNNNKGYTVVRTAYDNAERGDERLYDEEGAPFAIIGFSYLIPFIGIILFLTKHNNKERYARNCLLAGLFGVLTYAVLGVIYSFYLLKIL